MTAARCCDGTHFVHIQHTYARFQTVRPSILLGALLHSSLFAFCTRLTMFAVMLAQQQHCSFEPQSTYRTVPEVMLSSHVGIQTRAIARRLLLRPHQPFAPATLFFSLHQEQSRSFHATSKQEILPLIGAATLILYREILLESFETNGG